MPLKTSQFIYILLGLDVYCQNLWQTFEIKVAVVLTTKVIKKLWRAMKIDGERVWWTAKVPLRSSDGVEGEREREMGCLQSFGYLQTTLFSCLWASAYFIYCCTCWQCHCSGVRYLNCPCLCLLLCELQFAYLFSFSPRLREKYPQY